MHGPSRPAAVTDPEPDGCAAQDDLFRAAFDANPLGLALVERGADGRHVVRCVNATMANEHGWQCDGPTGRAVDELLLEIGPGPVSAHDDDWHERCGRHGDGPEVWTRWQVTSLPAGPGGTPRLMLQADVITERVRARLRAQRQARLLELIPEPVIIRALDGTVLYWNNGAAESYGHPAGYAVGRRTHDLLRTRFESVTLPELEAQLVTGGTWSGQLTHRHADGRELHMMSKHVRDDHVDGQPVILEINVDVTDRLTAERALAASEAKFRSQFVHSTVGQMIRHLDGTIEEVNHALAEMLGYRAEDLVGMSAGRLFGAATAVARQDATAALVRGDVEALSGEIVMIRRDGSLLDAEVNASVARGPDGTVQRIVGFFQDITGRKRAEDALSHRASHDSLTGLANRTLLLERITRAGAESHDTPSTVGLLYLDLDGFKSVNDTYGHHVGDLLLIEVALRLHECVRGGDTVARIGGDEFVVLCPDLDKPARLHAVADRVLTKLRAPYDLGGRRVDTVTASVGVSYPHAGVDAAQALREADVAMYQAKQSGKNRIGLHLAGGAAPVGTRRTA